MYNLEPLIDEVRDIIDKWEGSHAVLEDRRTRMQLCSCLDVIKDTALCLNAFRTTNIGELDVGSKYMYVYGSLQALVLQQDAVKHFTCALGKKYPYHPRLKEIRDIRNHSVGHPTDEGPGRTFNLITRDGIGNQGFELGTTYADGSPKPPKRVDIRGLIEDQRGIFMTFFGHVFRTFKRNVTRTVG